jgi:cytochrome c-type biogenesis protein CcmH
MMRFILLLALLLLPTAVLAVQPSEMLADPRMEARARAISAELRCLVCQNQSIDDSDADLAHDLRLLVRRRLQAGDSDAAVKQYLVSRYGDYILLDPPLQASTLALWIGAPFLLLAAGGVVWGNYRRRATAASPETPLSPDERQRLARLMKDTTGSGADT